MHKTITDPEEVPDIPKIEQEFKAAVLDLQDYVRRNKIEGIKFQGLKTGVIALQKKVDEIEAKFEQTKQIEGRLAQNIQSGALIDYDSLPLLLNRLSTDHANDDHPIIQIVSQSENQSALKACVKASNKQTGFKNQSNIHFEPIDTKVIPTSGQNNSCGHRTLCYIIAQNLFSNNNSIEIEYADPSLENSTYTKDDILAMHNTHNGSARHFIEQVMTPVVNALEKAINLYKR